MIFSLSVGALLHADAVIASVTPAAAAAIAFINFFINYPFTAPPVTPST